MSQNVFYKLKDPNPGVAKEIMGWADMEGLRTDVTMLDIHRSVGRIRSDKDFDTVVGLINDAASRFLRIVLRRDMNLFGILADEKVIADTLEISIRSIDVDSKEYFIRVLLDKELFDALIKKYELECLSGGGL